MGSTSDFILCIIAGLGACLAIWTFYTIANGIDKMLFPKKYNTDGTKKTFKQQARGKK